MNTIREPVSTAVPLVISTPLAVAVSVPKSLSDSNLTTFVPALRSKSTRISIMSYASHVYVVLPYIPSIFSSDEVLSAAVTSRYQSVTRKPSNGVAVNVSIVPGATSSAVFTSFPSCVVHVSVPYSGCMLLKNTAYPSGIFSNVTSAFTASCIASTVYICPLVPSVGSSSVSAVPLTVHLAIL